MSDLTAGYAAAICPGKLIVDVTTIASTDRIQGSTGLDQLADQVAARAERAGLAVELRRYQPGTPEARWWNFTAPQAASPLAAAIHLAEHPDPITAYPGTPCTLARGSASTPPGGVRAPLALLDDATGALAGAFVICPPAPRFTIATLIARLTAERAIGFAIESARRPGTDDTLIDRLEVPDHCPLVAFSVSPAQAARLRAAATAGTPATIYAIHDPAAPMPVVYARTRTDHRTDRRTGLLIAHLCHPAPGADDNASGAAALLAISAAAQHLHTDSTRPDLRFLWAPEMVGTAAYLHDIATRPGHRPDFAISVDMFGGDPDRCGGVLTIEQSPAHLPSPLAGALAAAAHAATPAAASYSGAVSTPTEPLTVVPFVGASDHLLFADRTIGIPSAHITRWPNRFHHSSADTTATISPQHLHRSAVTVAAAATALSTGGDALTDVAEAMYDLTTQQLITTIRTDSLRPDTTDRQRQHWSRAILDGGFPMLHQWHPTAPALLTDRWTAAISVADRLQHDLNRERSRPTTAAEPAIRRRWAGPWNLHSLDQHLDTAGRHRLSRLLNEGRPAYAKLVALALAIDDRSPGTEITRRASNAAQLPITDEFADEFFAIMAGAEWITYEWHDGRSDGSAQLLGRGCQPDPHAPL